MAAIKIRVDEHGDIQLEEVFSGIAMKTSEGNKIGICMRDDTFEINVMPKGKHTNNWWRIDMEKGTIHKNVMFNLPKIERYRRLPQWIISSDIAAFCPNNNTIYIRADATKYDPIHEYIHWVLWNIGFKKSHVLYEWIWEKIKYIKKTKKN